MSCEAKAIHFLFLTLHSLQGQDKLTMLAFLQDHFSHKYGVAKLAMQQQANFIKSLHTYKENNSRVRHFLTICGELHEEIFCEEISTTYIDMIKGVMLFQNYEGISEKLDDGVGNIKLTKKQVSLRYVSTVDSDAISNVTDAFSHSARRSVSMPCLEKKGR